MRERLVGLVGPRTPKALTSVEGRRYQTPTLLLVAASLLLLLSMAFPYWQMTLLAPQYPGGLQVKVYVNRMTGDVWEIDGLNHYIGMRPLAEAAQLERSVSIAAIAIVALLALSATAVHTRWAALLALPGLLVPVVFLGDMYYWLRLFGQNLDPRAPLSSAIEPFIPPLLGEGKVGQFRTIASPQLGLYLALMASILIVVGLYYHRAAFRPLVEKLAPGQR